MSATVARLLRYPVKGFGPQVLDHARLDPGRGLPGDRRLAVTSGEGPVPADGAWTPCRSFRRLSRDPDLALFALDHDGSDLRLRHPDGSTVAGDPDTAAGLARLDQALAAWFPGGARLVAAGAGYWDHHDAEISIINPASVAALAQAAGRPLDVGRFRGNVLLDGQPAWAELGWVGRRLRLGAAEIEVIRPIDRCRATSVDPATGRIDINLPALLNRHVGHGFCGVYARVVRGGRVMPGDSLADLGPAPAALGGAAVDTAPLPADWPRPGRITGRRQESHGVVSLTIADPLAAAGLEPRLRPGQHLRLYHPGGLGWRCYTVSGVTDDGWRISIRRQGGFSAWLHGLGPGDMLIFSGPSGAFALPDVARRPVVLVSAGIGITPVVAMARDFAGRAVRVVHVARHGGDLALWPELVAAAPAAQLRLHLTQARQGDLAAWQAMAGRPDWAELAAGTGDADVYLCGPRGFLQDAMAAFAAAGLPRERLHVETFVSPDSGGGEADGPWPPAPGPFQVRFAHSGITASWTQGSGSLLDLAEAAGLGLPAHCRSGTCGSCRQTVMSGETRRSLVPPLPVPDGAELMCCAVPVGDVVIAA